jgi:membrane-associated phospholipid phosphatase
VVPDRKLDLKVIEGKGPASHDPSHRPEWVIDATHGRASSPALRPVDVLLVGYLLLTSVLILAFPRHIHYWPLHLSLRLVAMVAILRGASARPTNPVLRFVRDWYPILMFAPVYMELSALTHLFTNQRHDGLVMGWERALFGGQPSQTLRLAWPSVALSEYLHFSYFYYYFVPTTLCLWLYATRRLERFSRALTATLLAFLSCCLIYLVFPVAGPYHEFAHASAASWPGVFGPLTHRVVESGSSLGTAFPSSHTAVAVCVWLSAWRLCRPAFWLLCLVVPALALATVYGGFHYAVDTLAGATWGGLCAAFAPRVHASLAARMAGGRASERAQTFASQGRGRPLE